MATYLRFLIGLNWSFWLAHLILKMLWTERRLTSNWLTFGENINKQLGSGVGYDCAIRTDDHNVKEVIPYAYVRSTGSQLDVND